MTHVATLRSSAGIEMTYELRVEGFSMAAPLSEILDLFNDYGTVYNFLWPSGYFTMSSVLGYDTNKQ